MQRSLLLLLSTLLTVLFYSCDKTIESIPCTQICNFTINYHEPTVDDVTGEVTFPENVDFYGEIRSDVLPEFEYLKVGSNTYYGKEYCMYSLGRIHINPEFFPYNSVSNIFSDFQNLFVEVKTSQGVLNGSISMPTQIDTIFLSKYDQIEIGDSFTISWINNDADFYYVYTDYNWLDSEGNSRHYDLINYVENNSITYLDTTFSYHGRIFSIMVQPINGPLPNAGTGGNMSGDGSGFLYYESVRYRFINHKIDVGQGWGLYNKSF
ncbi:MAG: hypothetical protein K9H64_15320 [Bacteroidales bacterium]|nr:hypothetical protein [Bacteroidales bacterium]MCF8457337.1 hypothetical protein [Bacteroidales bacterium]